MSIIGKTVEENMKIVLKQRSAACYFNECNDMIFHDLPRDKVATSNHNLMSSLGLGAKFCPQADQISFKNSKATVARLRRDARTRHFILTNSNIDRDAMSPRLHRNIDNWDPNDASGSIEGAIDMFELTLKREFASLKHAKSSYFTMVQKNSLNFLRNQKELMILLSDKNLGPMAVNRDDHIKTMMDQRLSNRSTYEIVTKDEAKDCLAAVSSAFVDYVSLKENKIDDNDLKHVVRHLDQDTRFPVMHGVGKLHKGKSPPYYVDR